jgi:uncharacterized protein YndB with AHSA1/START domain
MADELRVSALIQASPNSIYSAWLDERKHSAITGRRATMEPWVGGRHTAWDGTVEAILVELDTGKLIVMTWRAAEFPKEAPDSRLEVTLESVAGGTKVTIVHQSVPDSFAEECKQRWRGNYLEPMKKFFAKPGAMKAALLAVARAGRLPSPTPTQGRPGTILTLPVRRIEEPAAEEPASVRVKAAKTRTAAKNATVEAPPKKKPEKLASKPLSKAPPPPAKSASVLPPAPASKVSVSKPAASKAPVSKAIAAKTAPKPTSKASAAKSKPAPKAKPAAKAKAKAKAVKASAKKSTKKSRR